MGASKSGDNSLDDIHIFQIYVVRVYDYCELGDIVIHANFKLTFSGRCFSFDCSDGGADSYIGDKNVHVV